MTRDFFELVRTRRSIRAFLPAPIGDADRAAVFEAAARAPSAGNLQAYEIALVDDAEMRKKLAHAADQPFLAQAAMLLVFCAIPERSAATYGRRGESLYCVQDATIACAYAQLAADALGLGCVWIGAFVPEEVAEAIGAPHAAVPVAILAIGQRGEESSISPRRPVDELVRRPPLQR